MSDARACSRDKSRRHKTVIRPDRSSERAYRSRSRSKDRSDERRASSRRRDRSLTPPPRFNRNRSRSRSKERFEELRSRPYRRDRSHTRSPRYDDHGSRSRSPRRLRSRDRSRLHHYPRQDDTLQNVLNSILSRITTLESDQNLQNTTKNNRDSTQSDPVDLSYREKSTDLNDCLLPSNPIAIPSVRPPNSLVDNSVVSNNNHSSLHCESAMTDSTRALTEAIKSLGASRNQNYFVSNFDPTINDIDVWCEEVDRARLTNNWGDSECLSRVSVCLKGDARTWLNEWVTHDRTWTNFCQEFKSLCPRRLDYADILYQTMQTNSDKFSSYAEYARRTLLRLKVVKGLSDELRVLIVIRGITDVQVKAAATNAGLSCDDLVSFLSVYVKPAHIKHDQRNQSLRKPFNNHSKVKCYKCGRTGHKIHECRSTGGGSAPSQAQTLTHKPSGVGVVCNFCKKPGHVESVCFTKERSGSRNTRNVNLCEKPSLVRFPRDSDLTTAVVQGIPVDILIDSGALNISLISADVLKHFSCERKPSRCTLKGISDKVVESDSHVTLTIEFDEITIEADFVVVPGSCMSSPIVIGTDILNRDGITYVRTKDKQYLTRALERCIHPITSQKSDSIKTPLLGTDLKLLMETITEFSDYLISGTASSAVTTGTMHIQLTDNTPVAYRPYQLSYSEKLKVREIIKDLKSKGIVRDSNSQYASPIILVKKKDGSDRMCVDYRALNRLTVRDRYPLPRIDDQIDRLGYFRYFTSLDMATGFHQIPVDEESIHKTAFVTPEGHFEYVRMPFGLTNSPIVYQRIINKTLQKHIELGNVLVYVDDVLLMSNSINDGLILLKEVLKTLTEAGFSINLGKCSFLFTEIEYLGRVISQGQVKPSPSKIKALVESPIPSNVRQVRQFLGLAGYFRRYIPNYSTRVSFISNLLKKDVAFHWGPDQEKVRQEIISILTSSPILSIFDPNLTTEVHTDASSVGYGAVLIQKETDGKKHVVAYFSKMTQGAEVRYNSYQLETLAVVRALAHFRHYLIGLQFKVVTDCNALKATEKKKDLLPRVARWWVYLQDFTFTIEYRKGNLMAHADYLSRNPLSAKVHQITRPRNWAQIAQSADHETQTLVQKLQDGELDSQRYVYRNDLLLYRYTPTGAEPRLLCFVPKAFRLSLLRIFHDEHDHISPEKTLDLILKHFWFPSMRQFITKYIKHCLVCVSMKRVPRAPHQPITSWEKPDIPFQTLHLDVLGPLPESNGFRFILLMIDSFTKYCLLYAIYRQDATELTRTFTNAVSLFGAPKHLVTDRGRMFESNDFINLLDQFGCDIHYITPEMHNANGQVERYVRTVLNMVRIEVNHKNASWSDQLWKLQLILNITRQKTTRTSPLMLLVGTEATTPIINSLVRDVSIEMSQNRDGWRELCRARASEHLRQNQANQDLQVNQNRRPPRNFNENDMVFVIKYSQSTGKLDSGMRGPYRVIKALPSGRYQLKLLGGSYGKTTQAAAEYMVPWHGEWCPESCAAFFEENDEDIPGINRESPLVPESVPSSVDGNNADGAASSESDDIDVAGPLVPSDADTAGPSTALNADCL